MPSVRLAASPVGTASHGNLSRAEDLPGVELEMVALPDRYTPHQPERSTGERRTGLEDGRCLLQSCRGICMAGSRAR